MTSRGIIFSPEMVRAFLRGEKTQTRRVVKPQPDTKLKGGPYWNVGGFRLCNWATNPLKCPYGEPGNMLYVRETFAYLPDEYEWSISTTYPARKGGLWYRADEGSTSEAPWKPSIHMPKQFARIWLRITDVRVQRLQDISEEDAIAEGVRPIMAEPPALPAACSARQVFRELWDSINGKRALWKDNCWVWAITFERTEL